MTEILQQYWHALLWSDGYRFTGLAVTLWLLIISVALGGLLAVLLAVVFRGTPLYVQLLVFYSGMYSLEIVRGTDLLKAFFRSGMNCTLLALTLNTCAYTTEIFAGTIRAVPHGEIEAARAYGFTPFKLYRAIILPSALHTALAFTATVPDILKIARDINSATYQPFYAFGIAAVMYLMISFVLIKLFKQAEKR